VGWNTGRDATARSTAGGLPGQAGADAQLVPRIAAPVIDGVLGEDEWHGALVLSLDHQTEPGDNVPPSEPTEVRFGYDADTCTSSSRVTTPRG
jgi:hypothetical protein